MKPKLQRRLRHMVQRIEKLEDDLDATTLTVDVHHDALRAINEGNNSAPQLNQTMRDEIARARGSSAKLGHVQNVMQSRLESLAANVATVVEDLRRLRAELDALRPSIVVPTARNRTAKKRAAKRRTS